MSLPALVEPVPALSEDEQARTVRQTLLPELGEIGQRRLAGARVLVLGGGGLGAPVLQYLAAAGVGSIGVVDDDDIEVSNLHRQVLHSAQDVGTAKTASAQRRVLDLNPRAQVQTHQVRLTAANAATLIAGHDVVLDGTDNFDTRYLVADTCSDLGIPLVWASVLRFDAQVTVFWSRPPAPAHPVTLRDLFPHPPAPGQVPSCAEAGVLGSLCGIAGSIMATEAIKLISGLGEVLLGRVAVIDALRMRIEEVPLASGPLSPEQHTGWRAGEAIRPPEQVQQLDLPALRHLAEHGATTDVVLVDVREPAEAGADALPGAINVPVSELIQAGRGPGASAQIAAVLADAGVPEQAQMITYCAAGVRATRATRLLTGAGRDAAVLAPGAVEEMREQGAGR